MNEELALASSKQVDSDKKWETLCELLNSLGKTRKIYLINKDSVFFRFENKSF